MAIKKYLLDSNAVTQFINRREPFSKRVKEVRTQGSRIGTCEPVVAELMFGLEFSASRDRNKILLNRGLQKIYCWPLDRQASEIYGQLAAELRRIGRPMQVIDIMLASIAISLGDCTVVTTDSDLSAIPTLKVENWETYPKPK